MMFVNYNTLSVWQVINLRFVFLTRSIHVCPLLLVHLPATDSVCFITLFIITNVCVILDIMIV